MNEIPKSFIEECRSLLTASLFPRIEKCLEKLNDEAVWRRANSESNSIGNLLLHLSGNVRQWIVSGIGGAPDHRIRQQEFDERSKIPPVELLSKLESAVREADEVLANLDPASLLERRKIQGREVTLLYALLHVVEHFSMHAGQIILSTKIILAQDLEFYEMSGDAPVESWHKSEPEI